MKWGIRTIKDGMPISQLWAKVKCVTSMEWREKFLVITLKDTVTIAQ